MEMLHSHVAGSSKLDEPTTNPLRLAKVAIKEFHDPTINLVDSMNSCNQKVQDSFNVTHEMIMRIHDLSPLPHLPAK
jgi:hypothetical protein